MCAWARVSVHALMRACAHMAAGTCGVQKKGLDSVELELYSEVPTGN